MAVSSVMRRLAGLQAKMTVSYVVVTAAAVVVVEAVVLAFVLPAAISRTELQNRVQSTAGTVSTRVSGEWANGGGAARAVADFPPGAPTSATAPKQPATDATGSFVVPRVTAGFRKHQEPTTVALLVGLDGTVLASSYPAAYPVGSHPELPYDPSRQFKGGGDRKSGSGGVVWGVAPVLALTPPVSKQQASLAPRPSPATTYLATVYTEVPSTAVVPAVRDIVPSLRTAAVVLLLLLPVGALFGYLSTRRTVRRVRALERGAASVAAGDLAQRLPVSGHDELAGLETGFNAMAEQLAGSLAEERRLSEAAARTEERTRIARELHDSVSQDLFSLNLLSGGLRMALPPSSPLHPEVVAMERTSQRALREMQALLLELRPLPAGDVGLVDGLAELCRAYSSRLGLDVVADLGSVDAGAPVEQGLLRVAHEAMTNAVRHANPQTVRVFVRQGGGHVELVVSDDGAGFDAAAVNGHAHGLGLSSMRQRVTDLGGELDVRSAPGEGTIVRAVVPATAAP